jgi:NADPH:quinone reductase-like Zn-dependent oxidoreductase
MKAICVDRFGPSDVLRYDDVPSPSPAEDEVLVRVVAAGVGPWDAWVREGRSRIRHTLPLIPGADLAGIVERVGGAVTSFASGDAVFGATGAQFTGGYAEYAVASTSTLAVNPPALSFLEAAAVPVVGCTAWQMVFEHGRVDASKRVLIHGGAGNVGALAVQLARLHAAEVVVTALPEEIAFVRALGVTHVIDAHAARFEDDVRDVDVVLDTVGGDVQTRSYGVMRRGGVLVSSVSPPDAEFADRHGVTATFFLVDVTTDVLTRIGALMAAGRLTIRVGDVLPLAEARRAHDMLAGAPHRPGKIVLTTEAWPNRISRSTS